MAVCRIRVLIIDDEPLARMRIRHLLDEDPAFEILGECADGRSAVIQIMESRPDLVFLDIRIPDINGFEVMQLIDPPLRPRVIFVAADDRLDHQALEIHLADCLQKPISRDKFFSALQRVKEDIQRRPAGLANNRIQELLDELRRRGTVTYPKWMAVSTGHGVELVSLKKIHWADTQGPYAVLHTEQDSHLIFRTLDELEKILDPAKFVRISPTEFVQIRSIRRVEAGTKKGIVIVLQNGLRLELVESYRRKVMKRLHP